MPCSFFTALLHAKAPKESGPPVLLTTVKCIRERSWRQNNYNHGNLLSSACIYFQYKRGNSLHELSLSFGWTFLWVLMRDRWNFPGLHCGWRRVFASKLFWCCNICCWFSCQALSDNGPWRLHNKNREPDLTIPDSRPNILTAAIFIGSSISEFGGTTARGKEDLCVTSAPDTPVRLQFLYNATLIQLIQGGWGCLPHQFISEVIMQAFSEPLSR